MALISNGRLVPMADDAARQIAAAQRSAMTAMANWRAEVAATPSILNGLSAREAYQLLLSSKNITAALIGTPGLAAKHRELFGRPADYDLPTVWAASGAPAVETFRAWFAANWPYRTAANQPAFERGKANGELEPIVDTINAGTRTAILAQIDAVLVVLE